MLAVAGAALAARKRIAWRILVLYMVGAIGWNLGDLATGGDPLAGDVGEVIGLAFHVVAIVCLVLARNQFWAKVRRGALLKSAVVLVAGMAIGIPAAWALLELFPGTLAPEWQPLRASGGDNRTVIRRSGEPFALPTRSVRPAFADGAVIPQLILRAQPHDGDR